MLNFSLGKQKIKILLLEGVNPSAVAAFKAAGYENIDYQPAALPQDELLKKIADVHFVGIRSHTQLNAQVFAAAKKLLSVGCFCIGTNQVDLQAATEHGVIVFNAPYSNTRSVAELVIAEAIMLMRGIPEKTAKAHRGEWLKSAANAYEVRGKTLGIVGYGNIGSQVSVMAEAMGMKVCFYDALTKLPLGNAQQIATLHGLLAHSDVVSLHVPDTQATRGMIGAKELAAMKPGGMLINAARGQIVDIEGLCIQLASKHLGGAAIDVFPVEPKSNNELFESPLTQFDNVILTPHVGGSTQEAQQNIGIEVAGKLAKYSDNGSTLSAVNFPEVSLPEQADRSRLLHIHKNAPGVLTQINQAFAQKGLNITAQYLQTNQNIGYVVIDVETDDAEEAFEQLQKIDGTIKTRILH
jgi:D-3-phosphoglycerate dehydrogenase